MKNYFIISAFLFMLGTPIMSQETDFLPPKSGSQNYRITNTQIISYYQDQDIGQLEKSYEYDSRGNLIELHTQYLVDEVLGHSDIVYYIYNDDDQLIELQRGSKEFPSSPWYMSIKDLYFYDGEGRLILSEDYFKVEAMAEWKLMGYSTFDYLEEGKHSIKKHYSQSNPGIQYTEHSYFDENFRLLEKSKYTDNASIPSEKLSIKYDADGKILHTIEENGGVTKEDFYYENDSLIRMEMFKWTSEGWAIRERTINTYDNSGNRIKQLEQQYPSDGWDNYKLLDNTYDEHHNLIEQVDYRWVGNDSVLRHKFFHKWEMKNSLGLDERIQLPENSLQHLLFPNPTSGLINITDLNQPAEVKIYSLQGTLLKSFSQVESVVNISDLPGGVYILNLKTNDHNAIRKIVVKNNP